MKTGQQLILEIAMLSSMIAQLGPHNAKTAGYIVERERLRREMDKLPDVKL